MVNILRVVVFATIIPLLFGCGTRYEYRNGRRGLYRIDRITGDMWLVDGTRLLRVYDPSPEPAEGVVEAPVEAPNAPAAPLRIDDSDLIYHTPSQPSPKINEKDIIWDTPPSDTKWIPVKK
jgi:hypothetical protein